MTKRYKIINKTKPSKKDSYSWLGCLGISSSLNFTPHNPFVGLPESSPLIKFAILPRNRPIGTLQETILANVKKPIFFFFGKKIH